MVTVTKSRRVLNDAYEAYRYFKKKPVDLEFRHVVVLNLTLLRAVGHVLNSENKGNDKIKSDDYYHSVIKNDPLFKDFIEKFRNNLIKQYSGKISWSSITTLNGKNRMEYIIHEGKYKGSDIRKLIQKSLSFWKRHLDILAKM